MSDKWNGWYNGLTVNDIGSFRYGDTITYTLGYDYLKTCNKVEDWGCGLCGFKRFFMEGNIHKYLGIDGSTTPLADIKADLTKYTSTTEGIFMRHVLEHNYEWKAVLENACKSFKKKMCLILFTPFSDKTKEIAHNLQHGVDVPDLSFDKNEITNIFDKYNITYDLETIITATGYNIEHIFYLKKNMFAKHEVTNLHLAFYTYFYGTDHNRAFVIPPIPSLKYKCYYYTNNKTMLNLLKETSWISIFVDVPIVDDEIISCMTGKHNKVMPQEYKELKDYEYLCFLDSKLEKVNENFVENLIAKYFVEKNYALLLRKHWFVEPNVWKEYNESMNQKRYYDESNKYQTYIQNQLTNGFRENTDFHCMCGFLIFNMKHPKTKALNTIWYNHIEKCGIQDQIAFFFVKQLFLDIILPFTENPFSQ